MMSGKPYFAKEQLNYAKFEANAIDYALFRGYDLVKSGSRYVMREHDSMIFLSDGRWFWNSRGLKGRVIEFAMCYEGKTLPEAVLAICEMRGVQPLNTAGKYKRPSEEKKTFELPPAAGSCKRLFAYLCGTRQLDRDIVADLIRSGDLYESCQTYKKANGETGEAHNAVFVGRDKDGVARSAFQRGLSSLPGSSPFKMDVAGSDAAASFLIHGVDSVDTVVVFEAAIDAISHATIYKLAGLNYKDCDRIAQGGTEKTIGLLTYLDAHPNIKTVILAYDEDAGGNAAAYQAASHLNRERYRIIRLHQQGGKDWNDYLRFWRTELDFWLERSVDERRHNWVCLFDDTGGNHIKQEYAYSNALEYREAVSGFLLSGEKIVAVP